MTKNCEEYINRRLLLNFVKFFHSKFGVWLLKFFLQYELAWVQLKYRILFIIKIKILGNMEASVVQKHWQTIWTLVEDLRTLQRAYAPGSLCTNLDSLRLDNPRWRDGDRILFIRSCRTGVFSPSSWIVQSITPCDDSYPHNGSKVTTNQAKMRVR